MRRSPRSTVHGPQLKEDHGLYPSTVDRRPSTSLFLNQSGIGLTILVAFIALGGILIIASARGFTNVSRQMQLRMDEAKAINLAQMGIMQSIYNWRISNAAEMSRAYTGIRPAAVTGNMTYQTKLSGTDQGPQANYAYYTFNAAGGEDAVWSLAGNYQLRGFRIKNIRTNDGSSTNDNIVLSRVKVSWSPAGGGNLRRIQLFNGTTTTVVLAAGSYANGSDNDTVDYTLTPGQQTQGATTFLEWVGAQTATLVTVQWTFSDNSATRESKSHEVVFWNGAQTGAGRPAAHTFSITCTGMVDQTAGAGGFKVMKTLKATVGGSVSPAEIFDWDEINQHIP